MISVSNTKTDDALEYYPTTASTTEEFENLMLNRIIKSAFISINSTRTRSSTDTGDRTESQAQMGRSHSDPQSNSKPKSTLKKSSSEKTSFFGGVKKPKPEIVNKPASKPKVDIPEPKPAPIPVVPKAMSKKIQKQNDDIKNMFDDDDSKQGFTDLLT